MLHVFFYYYYFSSLQSGHLARRELAKSIQELLTTRLEYNIYAKPVVLLSLLLLLLLAVGLKEVPSLSPVFHNSNQRTDVVLEQQQWCDGTARRHLISSWRKTKLVQ